MKPKSSRFYSKCLVALNSLLCWGLIYLSVFKGLPDLAKYAMGFIISILTIYIGIGHAEYRVNQGKPDVKIPPAQ